MRICTQAICIHTTDYSDTSQVLAFLTRENGPVRVIAKGIKRSTKTRPAQAVDLLSEGELVFSPARSGGLGTLAEFSETVSRRELRSGLPRINAALYLIEIVGAMLPAEDPAPEVFDLLHNALDRLGQPDAPISAVAAYFQWRFLRNVGLLGDLSTCVACGMSLRECSQAGPVWFSATQGGIICDRCADEHGERVGMTPSALHGMAALGAAEAGQRAELRNDDAQAVTRVLSYYIACQLGRSLKMAKHVLPAG
jgi:DNA repair protein RecO (recombination protein O)